MITSLVKELDIDYLLKHQLVNEYILVMGYQMLK